MKLTKKLFKQSLNYKCYLRKIISKFILLILLSLYLLLCFWVYKDEDMLIFVIGAISFLTVIYIITLVQYLIKINFPCKYFDTFNFQTVELRYFEHGAGLCDFYFKVDVSVNHECKTVETENLWNAYALALLSNDITDYANKKVTIAYSEECDYIVVFKKVLEESN